MSTTIKLGIVGLGTVGSGTINIIQKNGAELTRRTGVEFEVIHASARDITKPRDCDISDIELSSDPFAVVEDPNVNVVVELIGGETLAYDLVLDAIARGKHVVTANKALIAKHGNEIFAAAAEKGVCIGFEAAVAGGIPIIKALREGLAANQIESLAGIINGTGNFILTAMTQEGRDFADVLKEAQAKGYAEADPTYDVEGIDAAHKLAILASLAFGTPLNFEAVFTDGISDIEPIDLDCADEMGYSVKHLGIARRRDNQVEMRVHPTLIPHEQMLGQVHGVLNAVTVNGDAVGATTYVGPGAGGGPTASAVVADILDIAKVMQGRATCEPFGFTQNALIDLQALPIEQAHSAYYLRLKVADVTGVLANITSILSAHEISIEGLLQKEPEDEASSVPLMMVTNTVQEKQLNAAMAELRQLESVQGKITRIRLEHFA